MAVTLVNVTSGNTNTISSLTTADTQVNWRSSNGTPKTQTIPASAAVNNGFILGISDCQGTAGDLPLTVRPSSGTIMGQATAVISSPFSGLRLVSDGNNTDWVLR